MAAPKHDFWEGCEVRELLPTSSMTSITRTEFWENVGQAQANAIAKAEVLGLDKNTAKIEFTRKMAESNLFYFCVIVLKMTFIDHDFGYRLCMDCQLHKWGRMWVLAREHFKSTIITCASTIWELVNDPNRTYCIYSYKQDMAAKFLIQIKQRIEDNPMLYLLWPNIFWEDPQRGYEDRPDGTRVRWTWNSNAIELKRTKKQKEMTIETGGVEGSSKTGGHFSHQIFDDCETPTNVQTPEGVEKLFQAMSMATNTGQTGNLNMCFIGTFYAKADAYTRMIKEKMVKEAIIQSCYDKKTGKSVHYSEEALEEKRRLIGSIVGWATQMLCDPSLSTENTFSEEWIKYWPATNFTNLNIYTFVDPSSGKTTKKHDYTTMWTIGFNNLGQMMCIDFRKDKMTFEDKWRSLLEIKRQYNPIMIYYEEVGMQSDIDSLNREMDRNNLYFTLTPYSPIGKGDKASRIEKVVFAVKEGNVWFPEYCYHKNFQGEVVDMIGAFIREEIFGYPHIIHEDGLDSLAQAVELLNRGVLILPDKPAELRGSWDEEDDEDDDYDSMTYAMSS